MGNRGFYFDIDALADYIVNGGGRNRSRINRNTVELTSVKNSEDEPFHLHERKEVESKDEDVTLINIRRDILFDLIDTLENISIFPDESDSMNASPLCQSVKQLLAYNTMLGSGFIKEYENDSE